MDNVTMDIPLLIRLFEWAKEEAKTDVDLHIVAERLEQMSGPLGMKDYAAIVKGEAKETSSKANPSLTLLVGGTRIEVASKAYLKDGNKITIPSLGKTFEIEESS
jgi:hypothetical protein